MCNPVALGWASFALSAMGTGYAVYQARQGATFQADLQRRNQDLAAQAAADVRDRGERAAGEALARSTRAIGEYQAALGATEIDLQTGTPLDVKDALAGAGAYDAAQIQANAARAAWATEAEAAGYGAQAELELQRGQQVAFASLLGGGTDLFARWGYIQRAGNKPGW